MSTTTKPKKPNRSGEPVNVWVEASLAGALDDYLQNTKPSPSKTATVETAIEEFLSKRGFWPPRNET